LLHFEDLADEILPPQLLLDPYDLGERRFFRTVDIDLRERSPKIKVSCLTPLAHSKNVVDPTSAASTALDLRICFLQQF